MATTPRKTTAKKTAAHQAPARKAAPKKSPAKKAAANKTQATKANATEFVSTIADAGARADAEALLTLMRKVTGQEPVMWGPSMVGFGRYSYTYASGRGGDWFAVGFSPRKANLTLYLIGGLDRHAALLDKLGRHTTAKSCLYVKRLSDVDPEVLEALIAAAYKATLSNV